MLGSGSFGKLIQFQTRIEMGLGAGVVFTLMELPFHEGE
jgi:hypothetical protein